MDYTPAWLLSRPINVSVNLRFAGRKVYWAVITFQPSLSLPRFSPLTPIVGNWPMIAHTWKPTAWDPRGSRLHKPRCTCETAGFPVNPHAQNGPRGMKPYKQARVSVFQSKVLMVILQVFTEKVKGVWVRDWTCHALAVSVYWPWMVLNGKVEYLMRKHVENGLLQKTFRSQRNTM